MVILLALLLLMLVSPVQATTWNLADCAPATVQTAINNAAIGDTVHLPTCTYTTWGTTVTIAKRIILEGNGTANTVLQRTAAGSLTMFQVSGVTGFEMRNMTLDGTYDTNPDTYRDIGVNLINTCVDFNIHHIAFSDLSQGINVSGDANVQRGVIHHNTFTDMYFRVFSPASALGYGVVVYGTDAATSLALGSATSVYVEDNTFTRNRHNIASNRHSRYVFRHNTIVDSREDACAMDAHGPLTYPTGSRQYEIYNVSLTNSVARYCGVGPRGGDGVIFNVQMGVNVNHDLFLQDERGCAGGAYPLPEQIRELYLWNNTYNEGGTIPPEVNANCATYIVANRDFWNGATIQTSPTSPFDGSTNMGYGTLANRPSSCSLGVAYFATDQGSQGTLYKCSTPPNWSVRYTPYAYPHPLQGVQSEAPTVSITTPTTYPSTTVSGATVALAGTAADDIDVTNVTWACTPGCGSGTATGQESWTIASVSLPSDGTTYTITVTATDGTLTGEAVLAVTRQDTPDLSGLEARWLMNDGTGSPTAADITGHGYTGTLQGNPTWGTGQSGGALVVDGVDDGMFVNARMTSPATLTLAGWVKATGQTDIYGTVLNIGNAVGLRIQNPGTTRMVQGFYHSATAWVPMTGATGLPDTDWHHVAYTLDATRQVLYLDGVVISMAAGVAGGPTYMAGDTTSMAGKHTTVEGWDLQGALDDLQVYTRALSEIDITALLAAPPPLTLSINVPTALAAYTSQVTPLAALSGSAEGDDITVTWSCPGCTGSPSGTASYVAPTWTVTNIPLDADSGNVITVTATDASLNTVDDSLTVTYSPAQQPITNPFGLRLVK